MLLRRAGLVGVVIAFARSAHGQRLAAQVRERLNSPATRAKIGSLRGARRPS